MPDGSHVLGGAPFNVAWHLEAFGLRPLMVTKVGADPPGDEVVAAMESWGMDTSGVQRDQARPTGRVQVELANGEPKFNILPDQAYDHIDGEDAIRAVGKVGCSVLYHGSLIARGDGARSALDLVRGASHAPVFVDVNLRDPWWDRDETLAFVSDATWVKVNQNELELLAGENGLGAARRFRQEHDLDLVIVTRGELGASVVGPDGAVEARPPERVEVVDTVGAGDAFSAVAVLGLVAGWPVEQLLARALEFAAAVCTVTGATIRDRDFYSRFADREWVVSDGR